jgi:PDZ-binding kinase
MEACKTSLGDLLEKRFSDNSGALEAAKINVVGLDVSRALNYLHNDAMLLHGDMKSFNILIKGDFAICKLCDFGVSIPITAAGFLDFENKPNADYVGTELWNAPEIFEEDSSLISTKSEIFSFGLVFYECVALVPPHTLEMQVANSKKALNFDDVEEEDDDEDEEEYETDYMVGTRPLFPEDMKLSSDYDDILQVFHMCTDDDPEKRPDAKKLEIIFKELN